MALIEGDGTDESAWDPWLEALAPPRRAAAEWIDATRRLVIVAPHPDDEVLACGGLLTMHRASGASCLVVALTDGEASDPRLDDLGRAALAAERRAERSAGLRCLGLSELDALRIGLPDGRLAQHTETIERTLDNLLRPSDVLVTTWRHDGHPDHEATGRAVAQVAAANQLRLIEAPVWMWHWAQPADRRVPWHRLVALPLPVPVRERKRRALEVHASQLRPRAGGEPAVLNRSSIARAARLHEHYIV